MSSLTIGMTACAARFVHRGFRRLSNLKRTPGTICRETPTWSFNQPQPIVSPPAEGAATDRSNAITGDQPLRIVLDHRPRRSGLRRPTPRLRHRAR
jgi:hypothetical protein